MMIHQFDGGLHNRPEPQFLTQDQGYVFRNIRHHSGVLTPVAKALKTATELAQYHTWFHSAQEWVDSSIDRSYLEYDSVLYWSDGNTQPQKYDGTDQNNWGIEPPSKVGDFTLYERPEAITDFTVTTSNLTYGLSYQTHYYLMITVNDVGTVRRPSDIVYIAITATGKVTTLGTQVRNLPTPATISTDDSQYTIHTFKNVNIDTDNGEALHIYRYYKSKWRRVGVLDTESEIVDYTEAIADQKEFDEDELGPLSGTYQYVMTYYNSNDGIESGYTDVSDEQDLDNSGHLVISNIPVSDDPQVDQKRIYRVGGDITSFELVDTIDNDTTTFTDDIKDTDVDGTTLTTPVASAAPIGLQYMVQTNAMVFGCVDNALRFTPIGLPDSWPEVYSIEYESTLTGLAVVATGLLVFTEFKTHLVTGSGPTSLSTYQLSGDQGCINAKSIQQIGTEAVWVSSDGICRSSGNLPDVVTREKLGKLTLDTLDSCIYDKTYYHLNSDGVLLAVGDGILAEYVPDVETLAIANDVLYGWKDGYMHKLFGSDSEVETFKYTSPRFTEGSFTTYKTYKKVFIYSSGYVKINILIDDVVVQSKELTDTDNHQIQVPSAYQRGFYIQFEIEGTGTVSEIKYDVGVQGGQQSNNSNSSR